MPRTKSPCYNCKDRKLHCHSICEKYKVYEEEHAEYRRQLEEHRKKTYSSKQYVAESIKRMKKKKK